MGDRSHILHITIDTREQRAWSFNPAYVESRIATVPAGDYALTGDEANFAIERKELNDFLGTISSGWERFQRELERMSKHNFPARVVIVEGEFSDVCFHEAADGELTPPQHRHPQLTPQFVVKRVAELAYMGVAVIFAGDAAQASALAAAILRERDKCLRKSE